ncbi:MAG TPA: hypothetical protein VMZ91_04340 [Candidatus Paceibacterota bacterium]|nr:hypothetical protein [Candidatus Paceibacterota bacterium]
MKHKLIEIKTINGRVFKGRLADYQPKRTNKIAEVTEKDTNKIFIIFHCPYCNDLTIKEKL